MTVQMSIKADLSRLKAELLLNHKQALFAGAQAVNDVAFKSRLATQAEMRKVFDRPSDYTLRSVYVTKRATKEALSATIEPANFGGSGVAPQNFIAPEVFGGGRKLKRSEVALQRAGLLPNGMYTAMPRDPVAEQLDGFGSYKGAFIRQLLSYLQARAGKANMTDKRRAKLEQRGRNDAGQATIGGVVYLVSRGGTLAPGIWAKSGTGGGTLRPVLMFVRAPRYKPRLDLNRIGNETMAQHFAPAFDTRFTAAMATAKP
jgi:hypothetical protein